MSSAVKQIKQIAYHRNGLGGLGFHVVTFTVRDERDRRTTRTMVGVVFPLAKGQYVDLPTAVMDVDLLAAGKISMADGNTWRGDEFDRELRAAIKAHEDRESARFADQHGSVPDSNAKSAPTAFVDDPAAQNPLPVAVVDIFVRHPDREIWSKLRPGEYDGMLARWRFDADTLPGRSAAHLPAYSERSLLGVLFRNANLGDGNTYEWAITRPRDHRMVHFRATLAITGEIR